MLELNKIYNMDCMEGMKLIEDNSVDLIVTDPPYNWNKGFTNDNLTIKEYSNFLSKVFDELYRISNGWLSVDIPKTNLIFMQNIICKKFLFYEYFVIAFNNSMANCGLGMDRYSMKIIARKNENYKVKNRRSNFFLSYRIANANPFLHPTQKDLRGYKYIIEMLSNEDDIIFDPFVGSGTTPIACLETNRMFIGFEIEKKYFDNINNRISNHINQIRF